MSVGDAKRKHYKPVIQFTDDAGSDGLITVLSHMEGFCFRIWLDDGRKFDGEVAGYMHPRDEALSFYPYDKNEGAYVRHVTIDVLPEQITKVRYL